MDTPPLAHAPPPQASHASAVLAARGAPLSRPALRTVAEFLKPITWFPPMWAFACGVVASGVSMDGRWGLAIIGVALATLTFRNAFKRNFNMVSASRP